MRIPEALVQLISYWLFLYLSWIPPSLELYAVPHYTLRVAKKSNVLFLIPCGTCMIEAIWDWARNFEEIVGHFNKVLHWYYNSSSRDNEKPENPSQTYDKNLLSSLSVAPLCIFMTLHCINIRDRTCVLWSKYQSNLKFYYHVAVYAYTVFLPYRTGREVNAKLVLHH